MKDRTNVFTGFPEDSFRFIRDLGKNNSRTWFRKEYERYRESLVRPAKEFISSIGDFIQFLNPQFEIEPKFNKTIMRIAKDMRFAKGKPYREFLLIGFHRWKWDSELFVYLDAEILEVGIFINNKKKINEPSIRSVIRKNPDLFIEVCKEYGIGGAFSLSELSKETIVLRKRFNPVRDIGYFTKVDYVLLSKSYSSGAAIRLKDQLLSEAMMHFSTLYPLWLLAESPYPERDLESHRQRLGPVLEAG